MHLCVSYLTAPLTPVVVVVVVAFVLLLVFVVIVACTLQMIIPKDRPLANHHLEEQASCK